MRLTTMGTLSGGHWSLTIPGRAVHDWSMKVASAHTYSAPSDAVFAVMTSPDVMVAKYQALGHHDVRVVEHRVESGIISIRTRRGVPMDVPGFAKRFFSSVNVVEQHDEWDPVLPDGSRCGIWQVTARGVPVTVGGQLRLSPTPEGQTIVEVTGDVMCPMPLVGSKIAAFVGDDVERTMHAEEAFIDGYLCERAQGDSAPRSHHRKAS
jgi:Protein of unknown function (DUF2505)